MPLNEAIEFSKKWYSLIDVGTCRHADLIKLCARSISLSYHNIPSFANVDISVFVDSGISGATYSGDSIREKINPDVTKSGKIKYGKAKIFIPSFYFSNKILRQIAEEYIGSSDSKSLKQSIFNHMSIVLFNGSLIHETLHLKHTGNENNIREIFEGIDTGSSREYQIFRNYPNIISLLFNVVEDVYIESKRNVGDYSNDFLKHKNNLFFPRPTFDKMLPEVSDINDCVRLMGFLKNFDNKDPVAYKKYAAIADMILAVDGYHVNSRTRATVNIFEEIVKLFDPEGFDENRENDTAEQAESVERTQGSDESNSPEYALQQFTGSEILKGCERPSDVKIATINNIMEIEVDEIKAEIVLKQIKNSKVPLSKIDIDNKPIEFYNISDGHNRLRVNQIEDFKHFGNMLRQFREVKTTQGKPLRRGSKIKKQRIWRISTDAKIFSHNNRDKQKFGTPEIILLLDMSGSMSGGLYNSCVDNLASAYRSLVLGKINCAAYGHTGQVDKHANPLIVLIASNKMPLGNTNSFSQNYEERFEKLKAYNSLNENYDGIAIREVSKFFTKRNNRKIMIVFSDGAPCGHSYRGGHAMRHTVDNINRVRSKNIEVLSLSLTSHVNLRNSEIYGADNNIDGRKDQLTRSLKNIIEGIVKR